VNSEVRLDIQTVFITNLSNCAPPPMLQGRLGEVQKQNLNHRHCRSQWPCGLGPLEHWDREFEPTSDHVRTYVYVCICVCRCVCVCVYIYVYMYIYICVCMYVLCVCICMYVYMYVYNA